MERTKQQVSMWLYIILIFYILCNCKISIILAFLYACMISIEHSKRYCNDK